MKINPSDLGLMVMLYNIKNKSKYELQYLFGYRGGNAGKKIQTFVELGLLKQNSHKKFDANNKKIIDLLKTTRNLDNLFKIVDDSEETLEEKFLKKLRGK